MDDSRAFIVHRPSSIVLHRFMMRAERTESARVAAEAPRASARVPGWVVPLVKAALVLADAGLAVACFCVAYAMREGGGLLAGFSFARGFAWERHFEPYASLLWFVVAVRLISHAYYDLYRMRGEFSY